MATACNGASRQHPRYCPPRHRRPRPLGYGRKSRHEHPDLQTGRAQGPLAHRLSASLSRGSPRLPRRERADRANRQFSARPQARLSALASGSHPRPAGDPASASDAGSARAQNPREDPGGRASDQRRRGVETPSPHDRPCPAPPTGSRLCRQHGAPRARPDRALARRTGVGCGTGDGRAHLIHRHRGALQGRQHCQDRDGGRHGSGLAGHRHAPVRPPAADPGVAPDPGASPTAGTLRHARPHRLGGDPTASHERC